MEEIGPFGVLTEGFDILGEEGEDGRETGEEPALGLLPLGFDLYFAEKTSSDCRTAANNGYRIELIFI